jgi:hypothetical protein
MFRAVRSSPDFDCASMKLFQFMLQRVKMDDVVKCASVVVDTIIKYCIFPVFLQFLDPCPSFPRLVRHLSALEPTIPVSSSGQQRTVLSISRRNPIPIGVPDR